MEVLIDGIFEEDECGNIELYLLYLKKCVYIGNFQNMEEAKEAKEKFVKTFNLTEEEILELQKINNISEKELKILVKK